MMRFDFASDIPFDIARRAHAGTSFVPDERGNQELASYAATLRADYDDLAKLANTPEKEEILDAEFARYREGYKSKVIAHLAARSRCMSTMITGGSNFPVRRQKRLGATSDKRTEEMLDFRERALTAIRKKLCPELRPIMAGDADAVDRLRKEIGDAERRQELMKAANAAIRKHSRAGADAQVAALIALGFGEARARELLVPDFLKRIGFADYQLTNNGSNIRRMRGRLKGLEVAKAKPDTQEEGANAKLEDSPADNRVRLFFPDKPERDVRRRLKDAGFRWAPSIPGKPWQAYRNHNSIVAARREAGIPEPAAPEPQPAAPEPPGTTVIVGPAYRMDHRERVPDGCEGVYYLTRSVATDLLLARDQRAAVDGQWDIAVNRSRCEMRPASRP